MIDQSQLLLECFVTGMDWAVPSSGLRKILGPETKGDELTKAELRGIVALHVTIFKRGHRSARHKQRPEERDFWGPGLTRCAA